MREEVGECTGARRTYLGTGALLSIDQTLSRE